MRYQIHATKNNTDGYRVFVDVYDESKVVDPNVVPPMDPGALDTPPVPPDHVDAMIDLTDNTPKNDDASGQSVLIPAKAIILHGEIDVDADSADSAVSYGELYFMDDLRRNNRKKIGSLRLLIDPEPTDASATASALAPSIEITPEG